MKSHLIKQFSQRGARLNCCYFIRKGNMIMNEDTIFRDQLHRDGIGTIDDITCGYFDCSRFHGISTSPVRVSTRFEIEYYLEDALSVFVDETEYPIKENHILIVKPGQRRFSRLPFRTMYLKFSADGILAETLNSATEYFPVLNSAIIRKQFHEAILLYDIKGKELLFISKVLELLHLILYDSLINGNSANINFEAAAAAKKFINENYALPISLKDIANAASLSPNYFHTVFKATCNMTPHDYLINRRILAAKEMMWNTDNSISEIAEKCGFGNQQYFSQVFKQQLGISPGQYRKKQQQNYLK